MPCRQSQCIARFLLPDMGRRRVDCFYPVGFEKEMDMIAGHDVVKDADVETLRGITQPPCVVAPVNGEPEQKLPVVTSMRHMHTAVGSGKRVPVPARMIHRSGHGEPPLRGYYPCPR